MLTGLDTGFFFALQEKQPLALSVWMERETITSVIVLYELQKKLLGLALTSPTQTEERKKFNLRKCGTF